MPYALNTIEQLGTRLNNINASDMKDLLYSCLVSASMQLLTDLREGSFDAIVGQVDEYSISRQTPFKDERYLSFKLKNGLVDETTNPLVLVYGATTDELDTATAVDTKYVRVDAEKGLVVLDMWGLNSGRLNVNNRRLPDAYYQYLFRITYDSGLVTTSTAAGKVYKNVPHWLSELSLLKAREVYHFTNPILNGDGKPLNAKQVSVNIQPILEANIRIFSLAISPLM